MISLYAGQLKWAFLGLRAAAIALMDPTMGLDKVLMDLSGAPRDGKKRTGYWTLTDEHGPGYRVSTREIMENLQAIEGETFFFDQLSDVSMSNGVVTLADMIKKGDFGDKSPLLEFLRHLRNGFAHGGVWSFRKQEPTCPAVFEDLVLGKELDGHPVRTSVSDARYIRLLDAVATHFSGQRPISATM